MRLKKPKNKQQLKREIEAYWNNLPESNKYLLFSKFLEQTFDSVSFEIYQSGHTSKEEADNYTETLFTVMKNERCGRTFYYGK